MQKVTLLSIIMEQIDLSALIATLKKEVSKLKSEDQASKKAAGFAIFNCITKAPIHPQIAQEILVLFNSSLLAHSIDDQYTVNRENCLKSLTQYFLN